jgi:hypothetical protein
MVLPNSGRPVRRNNQRMDRITLQRDAVKAILNDYHHLNQQTTGPIESMVIIDREQDQYLLILSGWNGSRRIRNIHQNTSQDQNQLCKIFWDPINFEVLGNDTAHPIKTAKNPRITRCDHTIE